MVSLSQDQGVLVNNGEKASGTKTRKILKTQISNQTGVTSQGRWILMVYDKNSAYTWIHLVKKFRGRVENTAYIGKGKFVQLVYKKVRALLSHGWALLQVMD